MKIKEFLQNCKGEFSSKRLAFIFCLPFAVGGNFWLIKLLVSTGNSAYAFKVWESFLIFVVFIGGYITLEDLATIKNNFSSNKNEKLTK